MAGYYRCCLINKSFTACVSRVYTNSSSCVLSCVYKLFVTKDFEKQLRADGK